MSAVRGFSEQWSSDDITRWAHANPTVPRVIGIDVGQDKLAVWFGAPNPAAKATRAGAFRFVYFSWLLCRCSATATNKEACDLVIKALAPYRLNPFSLASDIVIEKQHKKNGRMRAIAKAIRGWIRDCVPNSRKMRVVERQALSKFANIVQMPCPMPREYKDRKNASQRVVEAQVREWAGMRWLMFMQRYTACADDLADAALIAQDYTVAVYPMALISADALRSVRAVLIQRRNRNTWHKKPRIQSSGAARRFRWEDDDDDDEEEPHEPKRRAVMPEFTAAPQLIEENFEMPLFVQLSARSRK